MSRIAIFTLAALAIPAAASAQTPPAPPPAAPAAAAPAQSFPATVTAGATIYDPAGGVVGTVDEVAGPNATINTGAVKVTINASAIRNGPNGPMISMTKAELDAAASPKAADAGAALQAKLVPNAEVYGKSGALAGTIKSVDKDIVTLATAKGTFRIPASGLVQGEKGVTLTMTDEEFAAATKPKK